MACSSLGTVVVVVNDTGEKIIAVDNQSQGHPCSVTDDVYVFNGTSWTSLLPVLLLMEAKVKQDDSVKQMIYRYKDDPNYLDNNCSITPWTQHQIDSGFDWKLTYNTLSDWMISHVEFTSELQNIYQLFISENAKSIVFLGNNSNYFGGNTIPQITSGFPLPGKNMLGNELMNGCFGRDEVVFVIPGDSESENSGSDYEEIESDNEPPLNFQDILPHAGTTTFKVEE